MWTGGLGRCTTGEMPQNSMEQVWVATQPVPTYFVAKRKVPVLLEIDPPSFSSPPVTLLTETDRSMQPFRSIVQSEHKWSERF
jgi:hypothetical protein